MSKKNRFFLHIGYIFYVISTQKGSRKARGFVGRGAIAAVSNLHANSYDKRIATMCPRSTFFLDCANIGCKKYIFLYLTTKIVQNY